MLIAKRVKVHLSRCRGLVADRGHAHMNRRFACTVGRVRRNAVAS